MQASCGAVDLCRRTDSSHGKQSCEISVRGQECPAGANWSVAASTFGTIDVLCSSGNASPCMDVAEMMHCRRSTAHRSAALFARCYDSEAICRSWLATALVSAAPFPRARKESSGDRIGYLIVRLCCIYTPVAMDFTTGLTLCPFAENIAWRSSHSTVGMDHPLPRY